MVIGTKEPTFLLLGVTEGRFDSDRAIQVAVADAVTEEACRRIALTTVPGQGQRRAYFHPHDPVKRLEEDNQYIQELTLQVGPVVYHALVDLNA